MSEIVVDGISRFMNPRPGHTADNRRIEKVVVDKVEKGVTNVESRTTIDKKVDSTKQIEVSEEKVEEAQAPVLEEPEDLFDEAVEEDVAVEETLEETVEEDVVVEEIVEETKVDLVEETIEELKHQVDHYEAHYGVSKPKTLHKSKTKKLQEIISLQREIIDKQIDAKELYHKKYS